MKTIKSKKTFDCLKLIATMSLALMIVNCSSTDLSSSGDTGGASGGINECPELASCLAPAFEDDTGEIDDLPNGIAIAGEVDGQDFEIDEESVSTYASLLDYGSGYILRINTSNNESSDSEKIQVIFSIDTQNLPGPLEEDETFEIIATDLGISNLGSIRTTIDGEIQNYTIDSVLIYFDQLDDRRGSVVSGTMQVYSNSTNTVLTVYFEGTMSVAIS